MNPTSHILQTTQQGVTTITLNRPEKHNAFDDHFIAELTRAFETINHDKNTRVVVLNANGKNFCAGGDLNWMKRMANYDRTQNEADALTLATLLQTMSTLSKPIIALAQGRVMGGGTGLLACCDIVIAAQDAQFCFSEVKLGLIPATIAPYIARAMGFSAARRYFITAELFNAETALKTGLIHQMATENDLYATGMVLAETIKANGPNAITRVKQLINDLLPIDESTVKKTAQLLAEIRESDEGKEGVRAFLEKRKAAWITK